ncbi:uncharacterized protein C9orf57 homolog [Dipodomys spectabilis]|uniref:uncharacterized protein C9orf57 homolog n=1 Tax=Dipodomys spectabilis TaxID=105255 RepID=UPI001C542D89|nr:uncharacterized protein C9orf57 homolog [Dipodomys spectabilis]
MRKTVFAGVFIFSCLLGDVGGVICRLCNLSIPFHGCLLDFGTCRTKPGQFCKVEAHTKGGIQWYTTKGCTESISECFKLQLKKQNLSQPLDLLATFDLCTASGLRSETDFGIQNIHLLSHYLQLNTETSRSVPSRPLLLLPPFPSAADDFKK